LCKCLHPAALLIGVLVLTQLVSLGAVAPQQASGGVAYAAQVGGFIFGAVAARVSKVVDYAEARYRGGAVR